MPTSSDPPTVKDPADPPFFRFPFRPEAWAFRPARAPGDAPPARSESGARSSLIPTSFGEFQGMRPTPFLSPEGAPHKRRTPVVPFSAFPHPLPLSPSLSSRDDSCAKTSFFMKSYI